MSIYRKIFRWTLVVVLVVEVILSVWYYSGRYLAAQKEARINKVNYDLRVLQAALLKFRDKYGSLPLTLEYLIRGETPFLKELPRDPFPGPDPDRQTYYYFRTQDGHYALYSCGPNGTNDSDIDNYLESSRVSRSLGSGEDPEVCDDIILSDLPIKNR